MPREEFDALVAQIEENVTVEGSAAIFIDDLQTQLDAAVAAVDWAKVTEISSRLKTSKDALVAAFVANTPAGAKKKN